jgi:hypothetical protein
MLTQYDTRTMDREIRLAQMYTIGPCRQGNINPIIYQERGSLLTAYLRHFIGLQEDVPDLLPFFPELYRICSALQGELG